jgi:23S rRNA (guanosine2251-2'-O)-methyltransferase
MSSNIVYGIHAVESLLKRNTASIAHVFLLSGEGGGRRLTALKAQLEEKSVKCILLSRKALDEKTRNGAHQGVVAEVDVIKRENTETLDEILTRCGNKAFLLVLDSVQDPHNLGACLRSADAAGIDAVIIAKNKSAKMTPVVRKVACGAAETVPLIEVTNLARTLRELKDRGIWLVGTDGDAKKTLYETSLTGPVAVVAGNEGSGMRRLTKEHCDFLVKIPLQGTVSSLNVSVATGIVLFEVLRQRQAG